MKRLRQLERKTKRKGKRNIKQLKQSEMFGRKQNVGIKGQEEE